MGRTVSIPSLRTQSRSHRSSGHKGTIELDDRIYFYQDDSLNMFHVCNCVAAAVVPVDPTRLNQLNIYLTEGAYCKALPALPFSRILVT